MGVRDGGTAGEGGAALHLSECVCFWLPVVTAGDQSGCQCLPGGKPVNTSYQYGHIKVPKYASLIFRRERPFTLIVNHTTFPDKLQLSKVFLEWHSTLKKFVI